MSETASRVHFVPSNEEITIMNSKTEYVGVLMIYNHHVNATHVPPSAWCLPALLLLLGDTVLPGLSGICPGGEQSIAAGFNWFALQTAFSSL